MLQRDNSGALVATQTLVRDLGVGLFLSDMAELGEQLRDRSHLAEVQETAWARRTLSPEVTQTWA